MTPSSLAPLEPRVLSVVFQIYHSNNGLWDLVPMASLVGTSLCKCKYEVDVVHKLSVSVKKRILLLGSTRYNHPPLSPFPLSLTHQEPIISGQCARQACRYPDQIGTPMTACVIMPAQKEPTQQVSRALSPSLERIPMSSRAATHASPQPS